MRAEDGHTLALVPGLPLSCSKLVPSSPFSVPGFAHVQNRELRTGNSEPVCRQAGSELNTHANLVKTYSNGAVAHIEFYG